MSISQKSSQQTHEAVVFFAGAAIGKEMLYTEFEALLDCVVPMRDFTDREIRAAYVRLDSGLAIVAVVLFLVKFDAEGFPEQRWNVPLRMLAEAGARGPDLGGGPARVATRSQCPIAGHAQNLWDIEAGPQGNTLELLRERLHSNRLGIDAVDITPLTASPPQQQAWSQPAPAPQAAWNPAPAPTGAYGGAPAADGSGAVLALMQQHNHEVAVLKEHQQRELMAFQERVADMSRRQSELQQALQALESEKRSLLAGAEESAGAVEAEQRRGERKVQMVIEKARAQTAALRQELGAERDAAVAERDRRIAELAAERDAAVVEQERHMAEAQAVRDREAAAATAEREQRMNETLEARDRKMQEHVERFGRERQALEEQLAGMRAELTELRRDKLRLMDSGADKFFAALKDKGVKFVTFQPGAGHLTIPMEDLYRFIEQTGRFVAEKCGVSEDHYQRWLAHYSNPVCLGSAGHGGQCAKPLTKLLKPAEFVTGVHDRCEIHKQVPRSPPREKAT